MIKINRLPVPEIMYSDKFGKARKKIERFIANSKASDSITFDPLWSKCKIIKSTLYKQHKNKCCYCEQIVEEKNNDVDHFRPKRGVKESLNHRGYWWLAYEWTNYVFSCANCNRIYKKNQFPLIDENSRICNKDGDLNREKIYLINPVDENPAKFIKYKWEEGTFVIPCGVDQKERGKKTIKILKLDREYLNENRYELVITLEYIASKMENSMQANNKEEIKILSEIIKEETSSKKEYTGFRRYFMVKKGLSKYVAKD